MQHTAVVPVSNVAKCLLLAHTAETCSRKETDIWCCDRPSSLHTLWCIYRLRMAVRLSISCSPQLH